MRIHQVEIRIAGKHTQLDSRILGKTRDQGDHTEAITAPILAQYEELHLATRPAQPIDRARRDDRRPIHPVPQFLVLRDRFQVRRKPRRCFVPGAVDPGRHRDGVTPIGRSTGGREYDSVSVKV